MLAITKFLAGGVAIAALAGAAPAAAQYYPGYGSPYGYGYGGNVVGQVINQDIHVPDFPSSFAECGNLLQDTAAIFNRIER